jgi:hypothetical protein
LPEARENPRILVYVQAIPVTVPPSARKFVDLEGADFKMAHASKKALAFAVENSLGGTLVGAGFPPILREAVARGASEVYSMPLCEDPLRQLEFFPKRERFSAVVVGENAPWVFSGAALGGVIAAALGWKLTFDAGTNTIPADSVVVVRDAGDATVNIDARRIALAAETTVNPEGALGNSDLRKEEAQSPEELRRSPDEIAAVLSRRLRRIFGS